MSKAKVADTLDAEEMKQFDEMRQADKEPADDTSDLGGTEKQDTKDPAPQNKSDEGEAKPDKKNTMVPHAALEEERQRRKAAEKSREDERVENARLAERVKLINEALEANQKKAEKPQKLEVPDPEKDALGAVKALAHNNKLTEEENKILHDYRTKSEDGEKQRQYIQNITRDAYAQEQEYKRANPEYDEASAYLMSSRTKELMLYGATEAQAQEQVARETFALAQQAKQMNKNPAALVHEFAKVRGYVKKTPEASEAEKLAAISEGQKANKSLSDVQGNAPNPGKINAKDLATMSEAQFAKIMAGLSSEEKVALMGN